MSRIRTDNKSPEAGGFNQGRPGASAQKTLAAGIDEAFGIFYNPKSDNTQRKTALDFLIYAFDIRELDPKKLNLKLASLMKERNEFKRKNPEYIPGKKPRQLNLDPEQLILQATGFSGKTANVKVNELIANADLLDVNDMSREEDIVLNTTFLTPERRNQHRVLIRNGLLVKDNIPFDTSGSEAHGKKGWAAYTLNANGELSVFEHLGGESNAKREKLLHSSMNAGAPVYAAGELIIENGKLIALNTYSGHYQPSIYNVYRMLQYLSQNDVDISEAKIYTAESLECFGVESLSVAKTYQDRFTAYQSPAQNIYKVVDKSLKQAVNLASKFAKQYAEMDNFWNHAKDFFLGSTLTQDREKLAQTIVMDMQAFLQSIKEIKTDFQLNCKIEALEKKLDDYEDMNNRLSIDNKKEANTGRLAEKIQQAKHVITRMKSSKPEDVPVFDKDLMKSIK